VSAIQEKVDPVQKRRLVKRAKLAAGKGKVAGFLIGDKTCL